MRLDLACDAVGTARADLTGIVEHYATFSKHFLLEAKLDASRRWNKQIQEPKFGRSRVLQKMNGASKWQEW